jgi:ABC-type lipoprotein export system ATPase subunit
MSEIHFEVEKLALAMLLSKYPFISGFLTNHGLQINGEDHATLPEYLAQLDEDFVEDKAIDPAAIVSGTVRYIEQMLQFLGDPSSREVARVTLRPGTNKDGDPESFDHLHFQRGEIVCIVGPTGSGKSRLLADIEWMAQRDTPTGRQILINDEEPDPKWRFSSSDKLVAQLSQNMNFVMDLTVQEFIGLHADSRMVNEPEAVVKNIIAAANELAGETFTPDTAITALSGGQSRALMIADTAILSRSPIVLIDEIENAGIDRKKALTLLLSEEKIVLMATHDPVLALMGDRRIVIKNGGIHTVIETDDNERAILSQIEGLDRKVQTMRQMLRNGQRLETFQF